MTAMAVSERDQSGAITLEEYERNLCSWPAKTLNEHADQRKNNALYKIRKN